jgi:hypothetical protein
MLLLPSAPFTAFRRVAWCHGAAGYVLLLLKAAEVLGDPGGRYSAAAAAAGEDIWRRGLLKKVSCPIYGRVAGQAHSTLHWVAKLHPCRDDHVAVLGSWHMVDRHNAAAKCHSWAMLCGCSGACAATMYMAY